jgi:hypothetical protein
MNTAKSVQPDEMCDERFHDESVRLEGSREPFVVSFGGIHEGYGWDRRLGSMGYPALCLKDTAHRWYIDGCDGVDSYGEMIDSIRRSLPDGPFATLGQSAGAYAAIRVGVELGASAICAFAPQTFPARHTNSWVPEDLVPLRQLIIGRQIVQPIHIFVSRSEDAHKAEFFWDDHVHAGQIRDLPGVHVHGVDYDRHSAAYHLASTGALSGVLEWALAA